MSVTGRAEQKPKGSVVTREQCAGGRRGEAPGSLKQPGVERPEMGNAEMGMHRHGPSTCSEGFYGQKTHPQIYVFQGAGTQQVPNKH